MRFLNVAFVMTALTVSISYSQAQDGLSPEVFAACEAKTPNDFKQQLVCVKEQAAALNDLNELKKTKSRQIAVQPKADEVIESEAEPAAVQEKASVYVAADGEDYCKNQFTDQGSKVDWKACLENETAAHGAMAAALDATDSDIPGDPYAACLNYITAFQPQAAKAYVPQVRMLQCLKAKAPTRDFARCYQNYEHRIFNREVTSVSEENANYVVDCFVNTLAGGP